MIRLLCGPKGTGKTQLIVGEIDKAVENAKGDIVFITDKKKDSIRLDFNVRVLYTDEFDVNCAKCFGGFIKGLMAGNSDIEYLYIDGLLRIIGDDDAAFEQFMKVLTRLEKEYGFNAVVTVSKIKEQIPPQYQAYVA